MAAKAGHRRRRRGGQATFLASERDTFVFALVNTAVQNKKAGADH